MQLLQGHHCHAKHQWRDPAGGYNDRFLRTMRRKGGELRGDDLHDADRTPAGTAKGAAGQRRGHHAAHQCAVAARSDAGPGGSLNIEF